MFGAGKPPSPPSLTPMPAYSSPGPYQSGLSNANAYGSLVPNVMSGRGVVASALGKGVSPDLSNYGNGWLSLKSNPTDATNVSAAQNAYLAQARPGEQQLLSNAQANGLGGSSYAAALAGNAHAANQQGAFGAGLAQKQGDFQNMLGAWNALYNGPIGLTAQQNLADVQRGLGIAGLGQNEAGMQNGYNLGAAGMRNNYNLAGNQVANNFGLGRYQGQLQGYGLQNQGNIGFMNAGSNAFSSAFPKGLSHTGSLF